MEFLNGRFILLTSWTILKKLKKIHKTMVNSIYLQNPFSLFCYPSKIHKNTLEKNWNSA